MRASSVARPQAFCQLQRRSQHPVLLFQAYLISIGILHPYDLPLHQSAATYAGSATPCVSSLSLQPTRPRAGEGVCAATQGGHLISIWHPAALHSCSVLLLFQTADMDRTSSARRLLAALATVLQASTSIMILFHAYPQVCSKAVT